MVLYKYIRINAFYTSILEISQLKSNSNINTLSAELMKHLEWIMTYEWHMNIYWINDILDAVNKWLLK